jgi:hypothetical protein
MTGRNIADHRAAGEIACPCRRRKVIEEVESRGTQ